jgi:hypothetical protein
MKKPAPAGFFVSEGTRAGFGGMPDRLLRARRHHVERVCAGAKIAMQNHGASG